MELKKECDRAAEILKGFIEKGRIPAEVIANAKGIAIFTAFRAAMYLAGTAGSGVMVARLPDGSWSPPVAFGVVSGGFGVVLGVDYVDCVCVLNTKEAVDTYLQPGTSLGAGVAMAVGPVGGTADVSTKDVKPIWTYTKSRGLWGGVTVDGTRVNEKTDVNAKYYGSNLTSSQILRGEASWPHGIKFQDILRTAAGLKAQSSVPATSDGQ